MRTALVLLIAVGTLAAAPVPKDFKKADDAKLIVGTWMGTGSDTVRFAFAADGTLRTWYGPNSNGAMGWTWAVTDPKATPKRARVNRAENPAAGYDCVYELAGDTLKFALLLTAGMPPPDTVERKPGLEFHAMTRDAAAK